MSSAKVDLEEVDDIEAFFNRKGSGGGSGKGGGKSLTSMKGKVKGKKTYKAKCGIPSDIGEWEPDFGVKNFAMVIAAARHSGKTTLIKHLLAEYLVGGLFDLVLIFYASPDGAYKKFVESGGGKVKVFSQVDKHQLLSFVAAQKKYIEKGGKRRILVVIDDCADSKSKYDDGLQQFYTRGRHHGISVIFASQDAALISTTMRENSDVVICLRQLTKKKRDFLAENVFAGALEVEGNDWSEIMLALCRDYTALVLDNRNPKGAMVNTFKVEGVEDNSSEEE